MAHYKSCHLWIFLLFFLTTIPLYAGDNYGGKAGAFLRIDIGTRANALGNAYTGLADDATAIYWNPAGLGFFTHFQLIGMYSSMSMDRQHNFAALTLPLGKGFGLGMGWINFGVTNIDGRDFTGNPTGKFNDTENALFLSFSKRIGILSFGGSGKYIQHSLAGKLAKGYGFDIGIKIKLADFISVGATSRNIAAKLIWNTESNLQETIPRTERVGLVIMPKFLPIILTGDMEFNSADKPYHFGIEYKILGILAARTGYDSGDFNFGGGLQISTNFMNLQFDYALAPDVLEEGATNRFSILLEF